MLSSTLNMKSSENIAGKGKMLVTSIFSFSQNIFTNSKTNLIVFSQFILSSANAFILDQSKNLLLGEKLIFIIQ